MQWGSRAPVSQIWLRAGEIWKFGITQNPATRYAQTFLNNTGAGLRYVTEFVGTRSEALEMEYYNIVNYFMRANNTLPPGNKMFR